MQEELEVLLPGKWLVLSAEKEVEVLLLGKWLVLYLVRRKSWRYFSVVSERYHLVQRKSWRYLCAVSDWYLR